MIDSATGPLLLRKSKSLPTQKCHAPPAVAESSRLIDTVNPNNSAIIVENRSFQTVPKQKGAMNTLMSGTPISPLIVDNMIRQIRIYNHRFLMISKNKTVVYAKKYEHNSFFTLKIHEYHI